MLYLTGAAVGYKSLEPHAIQMFALFQKLIYFHRAVVLRMHVVTGFDRTNMSNDTIYENKGKQYC